VKKTLEEIADSLLGYDPQALHAEVALQFVLALVEAVQESQVVPLMESLGRVLADDVISPVDVPPHDNSAMDGYAFAGSALTGASLTLQVIATVLAGTPWSGTVGDGQCVRIMTGAVMPAGLDTVAPQEIVQCDGEHVVIPGRMLKPGDNRRLAGEDLRKGSTALGGGSPITPVAMGLLASLGLPTVAVKRRLKVAYFSTGDEILQPGDAPREGAIFDSNRFTVWGLLTRMGVDVIDMGLVRDNPQALEAGFVSAAAQADAIITSGGVSVGEADHTKATMRNLADGSICFWKIAMRPGRPMAVGRVGNCTLFGLPGNPVAVVVTFLAFVRPALLKMMGYREDSSAQRLPLLQAKALEPIRKKPGRTEYQRAWVQLDANGQLVARITGNQGSGILSSMTQANGLLVLPHAQGNVAAGDTVSLMMFEGLI
jgi:molybdopterin molybdotransferase